MLNPTICCRERCKLWRIDLAISARAQLEGIVCGRGRNPTLAVPANDAHSRSGWLYVYATVLASFASFAFFLTFILFDSRSWFGGEQDATGD